MHMTRKGKKRSQVVLETTLAFMVLFVLLIGVAKTFLYFSRIITIRHEKWQVGRKIIGSAVALPDETAVKNEAGRKWLVN